MGKRFIGIDFGGTFIKGGLVDENGNIIVLDSVPTLAEEGPDAVIGRIAGLIEKLSQGVSVCGIGLGIPGLIDSERGEVVTSNNIRWTNVNIVAALKKRFSCPIKITNDANAAALGEGRFGAGKKYKTSVFITIGTGVGGGVIIDGKIYAGNKSAGAEIGHMIIRPNGEQCTCGSKGCYETYASATALVRETKKAIADHPDCLMAKVPSEEICGKTAFEYADSDPVAKKVLDEFFENLAIGVTNIANILRPEAIIFGGGMSKEGERLTAPVKEYLKKHIYAGELGPDVEIICSTLKNAGVCGAAALNMGE